MKELKYKNKKTVYNGLKFDSKKEADRYRDLLFLEKAGKIKFLDRQVKVLLIPRNRGIKGDKDSWYIADFIYFENNKLVIEDVKSPITKRESLYRFKKKLLRHLTGIEIRET